MLNFLGGLAEYTKHIDNAFEGKAEAFVVF